MGALIGFVQGQAGKALAVVVGDVIKAKLARQPAPLDPNAGKGLVTSKVTLGVVVGLAPVMARLLGWELSEAEAQALLELAGQVIGAVVALYGRVKACRRIGG